MGCNSIIPMCNRAPVYLKRHGMKLAPGRFEVIQLVCVNDVSVELPLIVSLVN